MKRIAIVVILLIWRWPAHGAPSALAQLRHLGTNADIPAPPTAAGSVWSIPCSWEKYKGSCFYMSGRGLIYWIIREWDDKGPVGRTITGYEEVREKQRDYNKWVHDAFNQADKYPGVTGQVGQGSYGWLSGGFELPASIPDTGEVNAVTLRIPYFMAGARIYRLWKSFQEDCLATPNFRDGNRSLCRSDVANLYVDMWADENLEETKLLNLLRKIDIARRDILRFDQIMRDAPVNFARPEQLKPGFLQKLSELTDDLNSDIGRAEEEEKGCRQDASENLWVPGIADRLVDEDFAVSFFTVIDKLPPDGASSAELAQYQKLKDDIALRATLYRSAKITADMVMAQSFTAAEKLDLLARNDAQGKREALQSDLFELFQLLRSQGPLTTENHGWTVLSTFLLGDINRAKGVAP